MATAEPQVESSEVAFDACYGPIEAAWDELGEALCRTLLEPVRAGLDRHAEAMVEVGLPDRAPAEWLERSERLLDYRKALGTDLLEPLAAAFTGDGPSTLVHETLSEALSTSRERCAELPVTVPGSWAADALAPNPGDGLRRRLGKRLAHVFSVARKAGRARDVPLRATAELHLTASVAPALDALGVEMLERVARWAHRIEVAWVEWSDGGLTTLVQAEQAEADDADERWAAAREAAQELHDTLDEIVRDGAEALSPVPCAERFRAGRADLAADLALAGSFLHDPASASLAPRGTTRLDKVESAFEAWDQGVAERMRVGLAILGILAGATAVQRRLVWRFRDRCLGGVATLPGIAEELDRIGGPLASGSLSREALETLATSVEAALGPAGEAIAPAEHIASTLAEGSGTAVDALLSMVRQAPQSLTLHADNAAPPTGSRPVDARSLPLQELARQSFDAIRIERIRSSTAGLTGAIEAVRQDLVELPKVFAFAYEEALRELEEETAEGRSRARELLTEALRSTAESLRNAVKEIDEAVGYAQRLLAEEVSGGSLALLDRVAAGRVQARLLAARSRFADLRTVINERWGPPVERAARAIAKRVRLLTRRASRLLRRGSAMVGAGPVSEADSARTVKALAEASEVLERLPLVYQRLFTLDPVGDGSLLCGRTVETGQCMARWTRWREGQGVPLVVRGRQGTGITSLLNVLASRIEQDGASVTSVALEERITDEVALAALLADALELPSCGSLDELASALLSQGSEPRAMVLDNLEHLYLRVPYGTNLIERLLTLMAETGAKIFWLGGVTHSAWQLVEAVEPTAISQVDVFDIQPLGPEGLREAVIARHRRSGLPVTFSEPTTGRRLLRRRLRRMRDPAAYEALLENDFFDQLHRASSGDLRLAIFQWIQAADFGSGDGVTLTSPSRPDFGLLDTLSLTQSFSLKALLEHRTLTLDEHDAIFRLPRQESYQILESLGNRQLIEVDPRQSRRTRARSEIVEGLRYRLRPLLVGAVIGHLRGRNIVH